MKNFSNPDGLVRLDFPGGWEGDNVSKFSSGGRTAVENEAFNYVRRLARYRRDNPVLQTGRLMQYVPEDGVYCYFRYEPGGGKTVMVIVNSNSHAVKAQTSRFLERTSGYTQAVDIISGEKTGLSSVYVEAVTTRILELQK